ncbi:MAG: hypothetical protein INF50_04055 [Rhodobacter sp.]|nr:hypothetical protein [Rhodobacter sp.]
MSQLPDPENAASPTPERKSRKTWITYLVLVWCLLGSLSLFALIFHYQFIPAPDWVDRISYVAWSAGLITALGFTFLLWSGRSKIPGGRIKFAFVLLCAPLFGLFLGWNAVTFGIPMVFAAVAGHETEIQFSVVRADEFGGKRCRHPVKLEIATLFDEVCDIPDSFRETLSPGDKIVLIGRGTTMGLFPAGAGKLD